MTDPEPSAQVTRLLQRMAAGEADAAQRLLECVYDELKRLASSRAVGALPGQTMQPTALTHEAWLRLARAEGVEWQSRAHFFGAAARAMRAILVEQHRSKNRQKRGGGRPQHELPTWVAVPEGLSTLDLVALDEALDRLEAAHPRSAQVVMLRYFGGRSLEEVAAMLAVSPSTVERDWRFARTWLRRELA